MEFHGDEDLRDEPSERELELALEEIVETILCTRIALIEPGIPGGEPATIKTKSPILTRFIYYCHIISRFVSD